MSKFKEFVLYIVLPIAIYMLLKSFIDNTILRFFVKAILSSCYPESVRLDIATITISLIILISIIFKWRNGAVLSHKAIYLLTAYLILYSFYRIPENPFRFTGLSFGEYFKLLDLPALISIIVVLLNVIPFPKRKLVVENTIGFTVDEATEINSNNDLLHRSKFISEIAAKIINTNTPNGSFPIGVIAAWGSGKTTFLNTLSADLKNNDSEIIRIDFNAWKCSSPSQIIETFFKQLKSELSKYSYTVESKLQDYIANLLKGTQIESLNIFKNFSESVSPSQSIEQQYENVNKEIKRINKKVVIFIDDLDRLDKKEIYEVIRLIRNTANFSNTFYVVAYDRNYILNAIEEINSYQIFQFLEKIFQVEFALPPVEKSILRNEITKRIEPFITPEDKEEYQSMIQLGRNLYDYELKSNLATLLISNIRDVIRFINSFKLSYQFVKKEVSFKDFYNLEIIRFKHPELFLEIYRNTIRFFITEKESKYVNSDLIYCLKQIKTNKDDDKVVSELEIYLKEEAKTYKLSGKDISLIVQAYLSVFPYIDKFNSYPATKESFLSVIKPSMYNRYFVLGIEGRLSQIEFSQIRTLPKEEFSEKLSDMVTKRELYSDIVEILSSNNEFDNKEDFEKIITGIFCIANLQTNRDGNYGTGFIGYNARSIAEMLNSSERLKLYENENDYSDFLISMITTKTAEYKYENEFLKSLFKENIYFIKEIVSKEKLLAIAIENFKNCLNQSTKGTKDVWFHFWACRERIETPASGGATSISYPISEVAIALMRKFLFENDIDGLIRAAIKPNVFGEKAKLDGLISLLFGKNEIFVWLLKRIKQHSKYKKEFLEFYEKMLSSEEIKNEGISISFFKDISISNANWE